MNDQWLVIFILLILIVLIVIAISSYYQNKKWIEILVDFAQRKGYTFEKQRNDELRDQYQDLGFNLFQHGHSKNLANCIKGNHRLIPFEIFEYRYTTGGGKNSPTYFQTVAALDVTENGGIPAFVLRPQGVFDKLAEKFGKSDINFDQFPVFSKIIHLKGNDENSIRILFTSSLIDFFQNDTGIKERNGWTVESNGNRVLIYRQGKRYKNIETYEAFLSQAFLCTDLINRPRLDF